MVWLPSRQRGAGRQFWQRAGTGTSHGNVSGGAEPGAQAIRLEEERRGDSGEDFQSACGSGRSATVMTPYLMNTTASMYSSSLKNPEQGNTFLECFVVGKVRMQNSPLSINPAETNRRLTTTSQITHPQDWQTIELLLTQMAS